MPVLGAGEHLKAILETQPVSCIIISSRQIRGYPLHRVLNVCQERGIAVLQGGIQLVPVGTNGVANVQPIIQHTPES
jgi:hypothetical protein